MNNKEALMFALILIQILKRTIWGTQATRIALGVTEFTHLFIIREHELPSKLKYSRSILALGEDSISNLSMSV